MNIFIIVVTYNGSKWIDQCFSSVTGKKDIDVIAVDNNSTDDTPNLIRTRFPDVEVIETGSNLGFGAANNIGFKIAMEREADYVFLLNQDAWVDDDTIEKLIHFHQDHQDYGVISPIHLTGNGDKHDQSFYNCFNPQTSKTLLDYTLNKNIAPIDIPFVNAAFWLIPINVVKKVGGFDPLFSHYGEDVDYLERIRYRGLKTCVLSNVYAHHDREYRSFSRTRDLQQRKMRYLRVLKNINHSFVFNLLNLVFFLMRQTIKDLMQVKLHWPLVDIKIAFVFLLKSNTILKSRKRSKIEKAYL